jgi:lipopolysaccharide/colanic/teichoic acid biosynthesis glycosyltransferase
MAETSEHVSRSLWARFGKRPFDLFASVLCIILLSPILILTALAVKTTSRGPLLFRLDRTGLNGVRIRPPKFRSMRQTHVHDITEIVPLGHPAITPVGRFIRRFKIDELPQLFCVLSGQMSMVGPRPAIPEQTDVYNAFQRRRLLVRPGLTGLAQVNSSALESWDERIAYDVHYVRHDDFLMDMGVLIKTIAVVLLGEQRFTRKFAESPYGRQTTEEAEAS